ncbi:MAG: DUF4334 domain-containing protein [bacterium]
MPNKEGLGALIVEVVLNFRKVDNGAVMGIMEVKGKVSVYFYLERIKNKNGMMALGEKNQEIIIGSCGLICSRCIFFKKNNCCGCHSKKHVFFKNCPIKTCANKNKYSTCADCYKFPTLKKCKKINSFILKIYSRIFRLDRISNLNRIRKVGIEKFKEENK